MKGVTECVVLRGAWFEAAFALALTALEACSAGSGAAATFDNAGSPSANGGAPSYTPPGGGSPGSTGGQSQMPGGSAGTSTGGAGSPIAPPPLSEYDAHVAFDWPEAIGDGGATCKAGHYKGTFQCNFVPSLADGGTAPGTPSAPFTVTGPVELVLTESQNGEFLEVSGGTLNGSTFIITFTAKISGKLDCQTNQFAGMVSDGQYGIQPFPPGGSFSGPTSATYSASGPALVNGSWLFAAKDAQGNLLGNCPGTWSATYAP